MLKGLKYTRDGEGEYIDDLWDTHGHEVWWNCAMYGVDVEDNFIFKCHGCDAVSNCVDSDEFPWYHTKSGKDVCAECAELAYETLDIPLEILVEQGFLIVLGEENVS
jgi:hypothetical protein|tara:strand:+ start:19091 stop:19411 length:321 start_codon:yes stop_codon:yes gene_type:complete